MARDMERDMAWDMARDMAWDRVWDMAWDMARDIARGLARGMARDMAWRGTWQAKQVNEKEGAGSVVLPFKTTPDLPEDTMIVWKRFKPEFTRVHEYQKGSNQTHQQHEFYRNRTWMEGDPLGTGDLSLTLDHPTVGDTGEYRCLMESSRVRREITIQLRVTGRDLVQDPAEDTNQTPLMAEKSPSASSAGRVLVQDPAEDTNQTPLMAEESVCSEETLEEIRGRYLPYNGHAHSYTWKHGGAPLNMAATLSQNSVPDQDGELDQLRLDRDLEVPAILLHFNDDLTED
ncbi:unnamed protein product [Menidia menidia]|uniref:(Atlantic silverside) hypothetical protein n=1 Tax=Menidia menidia TaxID=238744 RepID=A0A8S4BDI7_9TELE|nr:unnamed protein product [Menidia menidia]